MLFSFPEYEMITKLKILPYFWPWIPTTKAHDEQVSMFLSVEIKIVVLAPWSSKFRQHKKEGKFCSLKASRDHASCTSAREHGAVTDTQSRTAPCKPPTIYIG
jgi:hypothetical protein